MRIAIAADSSCDLSAADRHALGIELWPIELVDYRGNHLDLRNDTQTAQIYKAGSSSLPNASQPMDIMRARAKLMEYATRQDRMLYVSVMSARSPALGAAQRAANSLPLSLRTERKVRGLPDFDFQAIDSHQAFAGYAWMAAYAAQRLRSSSIDAVKLEIAEMAPLLCSYTVPDSLHTIRDRALKRGEKSVGLIGYALGTALDIKPIIACRNSKTGAVSRVRGFDHAVNEVVFATIKVVQAGELRYPLVTVAYGGQLAKLLTTPPLIALQKACIEAKVTLLQSIMSLTSAVNVGPGAFSIGFATDVPRIGDLSQLK